MVRLCTWAAPGRTLALLDAHGRGRAGERVAARYLTKQGLRPVGKRVASRHGELDLVCRAKDLLVVVEVKTGNAGPRFRPAMRIRRRDLARRSRAARELARKAGARYARVDVLEVLCGPPGHAPQLVHYQDVGGFGLGGRPPWENGLP